LVRLFVAMAARSTASPAASPATSPRATWREPAPRLSTEWCSTRPARSTRRRPCDDVLTCAP